MQTCGKHDKCTVVFKGNNCPLCRAEEIINTMEITPGSGVFVGLVVLAFFDIFVSIVAAIIILTDFGTTSDYMGITRINPVGVGIGLAVLFQGIFGFVFFLAFASIAKDLARIKQYLKQSLLPNRAVTK